MGGKWFANPPQKLTMKDLEALLSVYVRVAPQKEAFVSQIKLDTDSAEFFQSFLVRADFKVQRCGLMFGSFNEQNHTVTVDCIYEPRQASGPAEWEELEDALLPCVIGLAKKFGLAPVGWVFSYKSDRGDFALSAKEVLKTASLAAQYGDHCVAVGVTNIPGTTQSDFQTYQVSHQIVQIYKEGTLSPNPKEPHLIHSERELEAVQEESDKTGKSHVVREATNDIDTALVTIPVPVAAHKSEVYRNRFSRLNRPDHRPTLQADVKNVLQSRSAEPFWQIISDFHLLIYLFEEGVLTLEKDGTILSEAIKKKSDAQLAGIKQRVLGAVGQGPPTSAPRAPSGGPSAVNTSDVQQVMSVCHCTHAQATQALAAVNGDVNMAIELLIQ